MNAKIAVLHMQSQSYFGSDCMIQSLITKHLDRDRFEVHAAVNKGTRQAPSPGLAPIQAIPDVHVVPMNFGPQTNFKSKREIALTTLTRGPGAAIDLAKLAWYIRRHKIRIIHGTEKPRDAFYGVLLGKLTGAKSIVHVHVGINHSWMSKATQWALRHCDAILGVSPYVAESATRNGYDPGKVHFIVNSLDPTGWDPETDRSIVRDEFGITPDTLLLGTISRIFPWKGHTQLLQALARIKDEVPPFKLLIVGEDDTRATPGHTSYTAELKQLVPDLGLQDHVIFTGFRSDVKNLMAALDVYTMPSIEEPCAVVFLEAMAMKTPIVALDSGGTNQMVIHGVAGLLSPEGDLDALTDNLREMLTASPQRRAEMAEHGYERLHSYHTPQRLADEAGELYEQLLATR